MFEKLYRLKGDRPADDIQRVLREVRARDDRHTVTLGFPPFERNWLQQITAVRLRFTPSDTATGTPLRRFSGRAIG